jgi:hypothetical protein
MSINTTAEYWSWTPGRTQGFGTEVSLAQPWLNIHTLGGSRMGVPVNRGNDYEIAFRAGSAWRAKWPGARTISLVMWTVGLDQSAGNPVSDPIAQWNENWQKIRQMFWNRGAQGSLQGKLTRRWNVAYQSDSLAVVQATAMAEIAGDMAPAMTGRTRDDMTVDLLLSDPYFYGATSRTATLAYGVPQNVVHRGEGVVGEGWPSAVNSFTIVLNGPLTTPKITNSTEGVAVQYNGTIASGHSVTLDILRSTAVTDTGANVVSAVSHFGARMWMALTGGENPFNTLDLTSLDGADTGNAVLAWNDCFV